MVSAEVFDLRGTITVQEAPKIKGCHQETVKRWIREGRLTALKVGLVWFINAKDLKDK